jgi:hypothetical protein
MNVKAFLRRVFPRLTVTVVLPDGSIARFSGYSPEDIERLTNTIERLIAKHPSDWYDRLIFEGSPFTRTQTTPREKRQP